MSITAINATPGVPWRTEASIFTGQANGTINVGDYLAYSGQYVFATNSGHSAYWKASAAGVALESNPVYDQAGRTASNSGLKFLARGVIRVSGAQSGNPNLGLGAFPVSTGSGVAAPTGNTGVGATWTAIAPALASGATAGYASPVGRIVGIYNPGQTAQLDVAFDVNSTIGYYG